MVEMGTRIIGSSTNSTMPDCGECLQEAGSWGRSYVRRPQHLLKVQPADAEVTIPMVDLQQHRSLRAPALRRVGNLNSPSSPAIHVSHGCLLIPVFFAAWWYYTKKYFRKIKGFIRHSPEPDDDKPESFRDKFSRLDEAYFQWDDISSDTKSVSTSDRFVKWVNRRNVRRRHVQHELNATTMRVLQAATSREGDSHFLSERLSSLLPDDETDGSDTGNTDSALNEPSMQWECLSDVGELELCAINGTISEEKMKISSSLEDLNRVLHSSGVNS